MKLRTALALAVVVCALGATATYAVIGGDDGADLRERWVSDPGYAVSGNHHSPAAARIAGDGYVFAPVSGERGTQECALVGLAGSDGSELWRDTVRPANCTAHSVADPSLADVDGDGAPEVLAATTERRVYAHDPSTGDVVWRADLATFGYTQPLAADVAPGGGAEVVVADFRGTVYAFGDDGAPAWRHSLPGQVWAQPAAADVDGDGAPEVVVGYADGVAVLDGDGTTAWNRTDATDGSVTSLAVGQADDDPALEAVAGTDSGEVVAFDGRTGDVAWRRDVGRFAATHALGDADRDGAAEVYVTARDGVLRALTAANGTVEWTTTLTTGDVQMTPPPVLGDVDGDGAPEVVAVTNDGAVLVVAPDSGDVEASYRRTDAGGDGVPIWTQATLADVDGDGAAEMYVMYADGRVVALELASR